MEYAESGDLSMKDVLDRGMMRINTEEFEDSIQELENQIIGSFDFKELVEDENQIDDDILMKLC